SCASTPSALAILFNHPTETVRVPVSRRPIVCGVVGGSHRLATSSRVMPRARRTSRILVIIAQAPQRTKTVFPLSSTFAVVARRGDSGKEERCNHHTKGDCSANARSIAELLRDRGERADRGR